MTQRPIDPRERAYFDYLSRCEEAFRPHSPIELPEFFAGRTRQIERLDSEIGAPGRHVVIYGERGVGKSSLAKLTYFFLRREEEETYFVRCHQESTFDSLFALILAKAGVVYVANGMASEREGSGTFAFGRSGLTGRRRTTTTFRRLGGDRIESEQLIEHFGRRSGLIVIDEYDRVKDAETHTRMAELIKHFSDDGAKTKIILVGVGETVSQLIGEHQSLSRCLAQIKLDRMSEEELRSIMNKGEEHLDTNFKETIKHRIVRLADGFPYFVHLVCRHACRVAARAKWKDAHAKPVVAESEYREGLQEAMQNAENSLVEQYQRAIVTTRRKSNRFELLLWALSLAESREVQVHEIAKNLAHLTGETPPKPASFSSNLGGLSSTKRGSVLTKVRDGYYKFSDPLLRPYIRFLLERDFVTPASQWEFPFMK